MSNNKTNGFCGLVIVQNNVVNLEEAIYQDIPLNGLPKGILEVYKLPNNETLVVADNLKVRNIFVTKENVMQQARGMSGNLFLSPVAKIKVIENEVQIGV